MSTQTHKVGEGARKFGVHLRMQNRHEPVLLQCPDALLLIEEQTQFRNEADVRERDRVSDQALTVRRERLIDAIRIARKSLTRTGVNLWRHGAVQ